MAQGNKPVAMFRIGYVKASVWKNEGLNGNSNFYNVDLIKSYKDGPDWKDTTSLGSGDLLNAMKVLERAEQFISEQK